MTTDSLSERLLLLRRKKGLNQEQLAKLSGVSRNYISQIERGEATNVSTTVVKSLAFGLGVRVAELDSNVGNSTGSFIPAALRNFATENNLSYETVERLAKIPFRGIPPQTPEQWRKLYEALKPFFDD